MVDKKNKHEIICLDICSQYVAANSRAKGSCGFLRAATQCLEISWNFSNILPIIVAPPASKLEWKRVRELSKMAIVAKKTNVTIDSFLMTPLKRI